MKIVILDPVLGQYIREGEKVEYHGSGTVLHDESKDGLLSAELEQTTRQLMSEREALEKTKVETEKSDLDQARNFLKGLKKSDLTDVDKCASAILKIVKYLKADK